MPIKTSLGTHPASSIMGIGALFQAIGGWGVALMTHPHTVQRLKMGRSKLLPPLCAIQSMLRGTFAFVYNLTEPKKATKILVFYHHIHNTAAS
jgi:hypothetical protein